MGSPVSAVLAELVMQKVEGFALETSPVSTRLWKCYVDRSNACLKPIDEICFHNHPNSMKLINIHFTNKISSSDQNAQCVSFLDSEVGKLDNGEMLAKGQVQRKSMHTDKCLTYDFHNPRQDKKAVVKSLLDELTLFLLQVS